MMSDSEEDDFPPPDLFAEAEYEEAVFEQVPSAQLKSHTADDARTTAGRRESAVLDMASSQH